MRLHVAITSRQTRTSEPTIVAQKHQNDSKVFDSKNVPALVFFPPDEALFITTVFYGFARPAHWMYPMGFLVFPIDTFGVRMATISRLLAFPIETFRVSMATISGFLVFPIWPQFLCRELQQDVHTPSTSPPPLAPPPAYSTGTRVLPVLPPSVASPLAILAATHSRA